MRLVNLRADDGSTIRKIAALLVGYDGKRREWAEMDAAVAWVGECFGRGRVNRVAVDDEGATLGWYCAVKTTGGLWQQSRGVVDIYVGESEELWVAFRADLEEQAAMRNDSTVDYLHQQLTRREEVLTDTEAMRQVERFINRLQKVGLRQF